MWEVSTQAGKTNRWFCCLRPGFAASVKTKGLLVRRHDYQKLKTEDENTAARRASIFLLVHDEQARRVGC